MAEQINISIPQTLYRRVRELARARKRPVDDVLVEVLDQALPPGDEPEITDEDVAVEREMQAYIALHPMLKEKYLGQHVAIFGGQLIDVDADYGALYERIDVQYPDQFVWLATVEEDPMPTLVFRSPRLEPVE
ncbi:MAG TPA: hypothetical protein ENJ93_06820 [Chloroflexi bacterium]|nr:hypothetical protein [Chloroflexota bacterium]